MRLTKVWVTKYALTSGVFIKRAEIEGGMAAVEGGFCGRAHYHGSDWHRTRAAAIARVQEMRDAELKRLEKKRLALLMLDVEKVVP